METQSYISIIEFPADVPLKQRISFAFFPLWPTLILTGALLWTQVSANLSYKLFADAVVIVWFRVLFCYVSLQYVYSEVREAEGVNSVFHSSSGEDRLPAEQQLLY